MKVENNESEHASTKKEDPFAVLKKKDTKTIAKPKEKQNIFGMAVVDDSSQSPNKKNEEE